MKIKQYLQAKYGVEVPTTITKAEAKILGIDYPLRPGWLARHGEKQIGASEENRLRETLLNTRRPSAIAGLRALGSAPSELNLAGAERRAKRAVRRGKVEALERKLSQKDNWAPAARSDTDVTGDAFLQSYEWRRVRMIALKKYGRVCMCCGATPESGSVIHVDHIKPRRLFPALALDIDNLQILCHECNHGKGNWDQTDWRPPEADDEQDVRRLLRDIARNG